MKAPRPLGVSVQEATELRDYMRLQDLDPTRWPALARLIKRINEPEEQRRDELAVAFHAELGGCARSVSKAVQTSAQGGVR